MTDSKRLTYPIIGPSRVQEKEIVWDDHVGNNLRILKAAGVPFSVNNSDLSVKFPGYGKFVVDGSDNTESLRGKSDWGGIAMDEFAYWTRPQYAWEEVVEPNLIVNKAFALMSSTTNGYDYFHRQIKRGDHHDEIEGTAFDEEGQIILPNNLYRSYRFASYDNPYLDREWLESKKATMTPEAFNREYLARFEKFKGLIYKEFDRRVHIKQDFDLNLGWRYYRAMDFGASNPTVCLWIAVDNSDNIYVYNEYVNTQQNIQFHANVIAGKSMGDFPVIMTYGDPSGEQAMLDYGNYGIFITPATKVFSGDQDWVTSGIEKVRQALKIDSQTGRPRLYVHSRCVNTIREFESYHWMELKSRGITKDMPDKVDDHCMDALRYFMVSYATPEISYDIPQRQYHNSYTGYSGATYEE